MKAGGGGYAVSYATPLSSAPPWVAPFWSPTRAERRMEVSTPVGKGPRWPSRRPRHDRVVAQGAVHTDSMASPVPARALLGPWSCGTRPHGGVRHRRGPRLWLRL